ncbi:MAG TPA: transcription antitermination factor NusB [Bacteroidota bacterium]|nr:transcription antitermination factor NusB [Bacteroidota bacterium]
MARYKRRLIREKVLQALYAYELSREPITDVINNVLGELKTQKDDFEFAKKLVTEVIHHEEEVEKYIKAKVAHWEFDRIAMVDRLLLRMGICEMLYFPDIPPKVTINESIEVAKAFSTEKSGKFINGVLDAILEELKSSKSLKKTGRGLINESLHNNQQLSLPHPKTPKGN